MTPAQRSPFIAYLNPLNLLSGGKKIVCRISYTVLDIFITLKDLMIFPLRYIGFRAYRCPPNRENLSPEDTKKYLRYLGMCAASLRCNLDFITPFQLTIFNPTDLINGWNWAFLGARTNEQCFYNFRTGLKAILATSAHDEVLISFGAAGSFDNIFKEEDRISNNFRETLRRILQLKPRLEERMMIGQVKAAYGNLPGLRAGLFDEADELVQYLKTTPEFRSKKIILTGQCMGGTIASYVSLRQGIPAICFNSLPLGAGLQTAITDTNLRLNSHHVTHISTVGDIFSDNSNLFLRIVNKILGLVVRMPANFGKRYLVPRLYTNDYDNHGYILASMIRHIGYSDAHNPKDIFDEDLAICSRPHYL